MSGYHSYINGFVQKASNGGFQGKLSIQQIDLSPMEATFFKGEDGNDYLWIKRKPIMDYDMRTQSYITRERKPFFEAYLKKQLKEDVIAYRGEFMFMRFRFSIIGVWDCVLGNKNRLNLYVERLPMTRQTILNDINERKRKEKTC